VRVNRGSRVRAETGDSGDGPDCAIEEYTLALDILLARGKRESTINKLSRVDMASDDRRVLGNSRYGRAGTRSAN
jgi:hypothetical protein